MSNQYWNRPCLTEGCHGRAYPQSEYCKNCREVRKKRIHKKPEKYKKDSSGHVICFECGLCKDCGDCEKLGCGYKITKKWI